MERILQNVVIAGVGMTRFNRFYDRTLKDLSREAVQKAVDHSGISQKEIEAAYVGNSVAGLINGQETIRGQVLLNENNIGGIPIFNIENACASSSTAFHLAYASIAAGTHECVLVVGAEKMTHEDRIRTFKAFESGLDVELYAEQLNNRDHSHSVFMDVYAQNAKNFMNKTGITQRHLAMISAKNHTNGSLNPYAQYQKAQTVEDVLQSRLITDPFTKLMCSPVSDGAAAMILCSESYGKKLTTKPITVASSIVRSSKKERGPGEGVIERASRAAYEEAGISPGDLDLVEVHDAAASAEIIAYEELGLCTSGDVLKFVEEQKTHLNGLIPVNVSGGLEAKGHPIGATGLGQIIELVWQLRGEAGDRQVPNNPKVGLAENAGGYLNDENAACTITILKR